MNNSNIRIYVNKYNDYKNWNVILKVSGIKLSVSGNYSNHIQ